MPDFIILGNVRWKEEGKGGNSSQSYTRAALKLGWRVSYVQRDGINSLVPLDDIRPGPEVIAMCDMPWVELYFHLFRELKARGCRTVYRIVDNWLLTPRRVDYSEEREVEFITLADCVFASNPLSIERFRHVRQDIRLLRNGVDLDMFWHWRGAPPADVVTGTPTAAFLASFWDPAWVDWEGLTLAAQTLPDLSVNILGNPAAASERDLPPNVHLLGICPWTMLPAYLHQCDVGLVAYDGERTRYNNPIKVLEYLGSGLPVVSPANPSIAGYPYVYTYSRPEELAGAISKAVSTPIDREQLYLTLQQHTWTARLQELVEIAFASPSPASAAPPKEGEPAMPPPDHSHRSAAQPPLSALLDRFRQSLADTPSTPPGDTPPRTAR